jgi:hypothetical protein
VNQPALNGGEVSGDGWHRGGGAALTDALDRLLSVVSRLDCTWFVIIAKFAMPEMRLNRKTS